jgi:TolA-binding protein
MQAKTEKNNLVIKMTENHEATVGQLSKQVVAMKTDIHELQERTKTVEAQLGKITEGQTLILAQFAGKPEPKPIADLKMVRSSADGD